MKTNRMTFIGLRVVISLLTLITALFHILVFYPDFDLWFTLNGLGFIGLLVALLVPLPILKNFPRLVRYGFIGYTLLTILMWIILQGEQTTQAYLIEVDQVVLIVLLWLDGRLAKK
jgi:hypothetical protein